MNVEKFVLEEVAAQELMEYGAVGVNQDSALTGGEDVSGKDGTSDVFVIEMVIEPCTPTAKRMAVLFLVFFIYVTFLVFVLCNVFGSLNKMANYG